MFRAAATSIANWAEEQGGIPLFTIEGESALALLALSVFALLYTACM